MTQKTNDAVEATDEVSAEEGGDLLAAVSDAVDAETVQPEALDEAAGGDEQAASDEGEAASAEGGTENTPDAEQSPDGTQNEGGHVEAEGGSNEDETQGERQDPDHVNDPIPDEVRGRTRERMEYLTNTVKETSGERDKFRQERDELLGMLTETGASPEQFGGTLEFLKNANTDSPAAKKHAIQYLRTQLEALGSELGEPVEGVNLLGRYEDLQSEVDSGEITQERALEIASARAARDAQQQKSEQREQAESAQHEYSAAVESGRASLNALEQKLSADPDYQRKREALVPALQSLMSEIHPSKWAETFYKAYTQMAAPQAVNAPNAQSAPKPQPMRPKQPAGGGVKVPNSLEEAVSAGIDRAVGR